MCAPGEYVSPKDVEPVAAKIRREILHASDVSDISDEGSDELEKRRTTRWCLECGDPKKTRHDYCYRCWELKDNLERPLRTFIRGTKLSRKNYTRGNMYHPKDVFDVQKTLTVGSGRCETNPILFLRCGRRS